MSEEESKRPELSRLRELIHEEAYGCDDVGEVVSCCMAAIDRYVTEIESKNGTFDDNRPVYDEFGIPYAYEFPWDKIPPECKYVAKDADGPCSLSNVYLSRRPMENYAYIRGDGDPDEDGHSCDWNPILTPFDTVVRARAEYPNVSPREISCMENVAEDIKLPGWFSDLTGTESLHRRPPDA